MIRLFKIIMCSYNFSQNVRNFPRNRISIGNGNEVPQAILDFLRTQEQFTLHGSGYSMFPLIQQKDRILVRSIDPKSVNIGDIIAFKYPNQENIIVVHRVISIQRNQLIIFSTKGDRSIKLDFPVPAKLLMGKVIQVTTASGKIINFESSLGRIVNITITFVQISLLSLSDLIRKGYFPSILERKIILFGRYFSQMLVRFIRGSF